MIYLKVLWHHFSEADPVVLYSEIGDNKMEVRKIELFRNGSYGFATVDREYNSSRLGEVPVPDIDEIELDTEFKPSFICREEFEEAWKQALDSIK
jgi:hypothetical protein